MHRTDHHPVDKSALALAVHRIEGVGKSGADRESTLPAWTPGETRRRRAAGGCRPRTVAIIRAEVEGGWHGWTPETHDEGAHRLAIDSHPMRRPGPS